MDFAKGEINSKPIKILSAAEVYSFEFLGRSYVLRGDGGYQDVRFEIFASQLSDDLALERSTRPVLLSTFQRQNLILKLSQLAESEASKKLIVLLSSARDISLTIFIPGEPKILEQLSTVALWDNSFNDLMLQDPGMLRKAWSNLGKSTEFLKSEFYKIKTQERYEFFAEYIKLRVPHQLLSELADILVIRAILGDHDFIFENWIQIEGHAIGIDLANVFRHDEKVKPSILSNPLTVPWQSIPRLYYSSVTNALIDKLKSLDSNQIDHAAKIAGYNLKAQEVNQIRQRRDKMLVDIANSRSHELRGF